MSLFIFFDTVESILNLNILANLKSYLLSPVKDGFAGVVDTAEEFLTGKVCFAGVVDTSEEFFAGVVNTDKTL